MEPRMNHFDDIEDLYPGFVDPKIRVKVLQKWSYGEEDNRVIKFVIADVEGGKINGYIPNNLIEIFDDLLTEGSWVNIHKFRVRSDFSDYRAVKNAFKIMLTNETRVRLSNFRNDCNFFKFVDYNRINDRIETESAYVDIIGTLVGVEELVDENPYGENDTRKNNISFLMRDKDAEIIHCYATGVTALMIDFEWHHGRENCTVCILRFWAINYHNTFPKLYNREPCAEILFNPVFPEINEIRNSLIELQKQVEEAEMYGSESELESE